MNYHHLTIEERSYIRKYYEKGLGYRETTRFISVGFNREHDKTVNVLDT